MIRVAILFATKDVMIAKVVIQRVRIATIVTRAIVDVTLLVTKDVMIAKVVTVYVRLISRALPVTQIVTTITQQKAKSLVVTLRLGVIPESQGLHKCFARSHPKPLNLISFYAEYRLLFFAITFTVFALMLIIHSL